MLRTMSKRLIIFIASCLAMCSLLSAQPVRIMDTLRRLDMENIAVRQRGDTVTVAFEPTPYRGVYRGIDAAIRGLAAIPELPTLQLVVLDHAVPQLCITLPSGLVKAYQVKECSLEDLYRTMDITVATRPAMRELKGARSYYRSFGQTDLVLYPGVMLANNLRTKLYRYAVELQPALEMQLWKGALIRAQVCLPLVNNEEGKWDCIRLGYLTLSQRFRWGDHWQGEVTAGNFSADRQGAALSFGYLSSDGRLTVGMTGGVTGVSHLYGSDWHIGTWKRYNGMLKAGYYLPGCHTQLKAEAGRFLYGDYGVRGTLSRYFGEYIVGVYALYTDGEKNAGFHFSIPLPGKKRSRKNGFRIMLPDYFSFRYDMRSGNAYARRRLGETYHTEPTSAENSRFYQPDYVRYYLIRTLKNENN